MDKKSRKFLNFSIWGFAVMYTLLGFFFENMERGLSMALGAFGMWFMMTAYQNFLREID